LKACRKPWRADRSRPAIYLTDRIDSAHQAFGILNFFESFITRSFFGYHP
jgi:hypothetical protein